MTKKKLTYFCSYSAFVFVYSASALSSIVQVGPNTPGVSPAFAALGPMYQAADLIWSWVSSQDMNQYDAEKYCKD